MSEALKGIRLEFLKELGMLDIPETMRNVDVQHFALFLGESGWGMLKPGTGMWDDYRMWSENKERKL